MQGREVGGTSYPAVHRYLKGEVTPSIEFLTAAAQLLGVREAWLMTGQGQSTEEEDRAGGADELRSAENALWGEFASRIPGYGLLTSFEHSLFFSAVERLLWTRSDADEADVAHSQEEYLAAAELLWDMLWVDDWWGMRGPLELFDPWNPERLQDYCAAMLHALMLGMKRTGEGEPISDLHRQLERRPERWYIALPGQAIEAVMVSKKTVRIGLGRNRKDVRDYIRDLLRMIPPARGIDEWLEEWEREGGQIFVQLRQGPGEIETAIERLVAELPPEAVLSRERIGPARVTLRVDPQRNASIAEWIREIPLEDSETGRSAWKALLEEGGALTLLYPRPEREMEERTGEEGSKRSGAEG
jgi:transcriptional regulator with XRE-family HTH domain